MVLFAKGLAQEFALAKRDELNALSGKIAVAVGQDQNVLAVRNLLSADMATQGNLNPQLMPGHGLTKKGHNRIIGNVDAQRSTCC